MNRRFVPALLLCCQTAMSGCAPRSNARPVTKPQTIFAASLPITPPGSYAQEIAAAKQEGIPIGPQALQAPLLPPEQNAAPLYTQLTLLRKTRPLSQGDDGVIAAMVGRTMPSAAQWTQARQALQHRPDLLRLAHQIAARPKCVFVRNWKAPEYVPFPEFEQMRAAFGLLNAESLLLAQAGKPPDAVRNAALGFRIAHQADGENLLIAYSFGFSYDAYTLNSMEKILTMAGNDPTVVDAVQKEIKTKWTPPDLIHSLRTEAGGQVGDVEMFRKLGPASFGASTAHMKPQAWNAFLNYDGAFMLHHMRQGINVAKRPFLQAAPTLRSLDGQVEGPMTPTLSRILLPQIEQVAAVHARIQAQVDTVRAAIAVLKWKAQHGTFPTTLTQAVTPVPTDPFDGKSLRYRQEGTGFVIYSVGENGTFDGGTPDKKPEFKEVVFRYPLPPYSQTTATASR